MFRAIWRGDREAGQGSARVGGGVAGIRRREPLESESSNTRVIEGTRGQGTTRFSLFGGGTGPLVPRQFTVDCGGSMRILAGGIMSFANATEVLHAWMRGVNERRLDEVLGLYAEGAVLLPTFSPHAITTPDMRRRYFEQLAARPGLSVTLHQRTVRDQAMEGTLRVISGIYCFRMEIDGEPLGFEARFSYVMDPGVVRPILHHHSSQIPRNLS